MRPGPRASAAPDLAGSLVLGIDPGVRTGVALLRHCPTTPWPCIATWTVPLDELPHELTRGVVAAACPRDKTLAVLETWRAMGGKKIRGLAHQAYAAGVAWASLTVGGFERIVTYDRNEILRAAGLHKSAGKPQVRKWLPALVTPENDHPCLRNEHERDAALAAFVGGSRMIGMLS